jgi:pimeloyl-ACP methyl ester carboxylesterase
MSIDQHSFYFGKSGDALLGVYYPPTSIIPEHNQSIILCPPFGQEYLRSHRAFRQLALLLAREGFHVMRFDYYGTGDSDGDLESANIDRWIDDISAASNELINISGCEQQSLIGLRFGSTLAFLHAQQSTAQLQSLTLWEPVLSGVRYLAEFGDTPENPITNIMGFPVDSKLHSEISALQLTPTNIDNIGTINCVASSTNQDQEKFLQTLDYHASVTQTVIPIEGDWAKADEFLSAMLPREMIMSIVNNLTGATD